MRILLANKYWYLKGGAERVVFETKRLLERNGDATSAFAMRDAKNEASPWEKFFVSAVQTDHVTSAMEALRTAGRMLWSFEAAKKFGALLDEAKPDVIHAHNIYHQLSPSILAVARKRRVPVVMTLHDYHLVSPNYGLFDRGHVVEPSPKHPYWDTFRRKLIGGSAAKSALSAFEGWLHHAIGAYAHVSKFVVPSEFARRKMEAYGIEGKRLEVVPHFIDLEGRAPRYESEARVVFVGRLSEEKGVDVLLRAMKDVRGLTCAIVGDGPEKAKLVALAEELKIENVETLGALYGIDLEREIARARAVVIPSRSYETFGLTALEAYAWGKPVIAARIGALPEVVQETKTGLLFEPGDHQDLAAKLNWLSGEYARAAAMGREGRRLAETDYAPGLHLGRIHRIYKEAIAKK
ncbi:MAG TPA: glycosyltransferase family 4 protein [Candidatus Baltobacteraceae bacterium]|nr:glycosyltransferase family 4 protein [Candidatus Baltobacteraceae bacterium]